MTRTSASSARQIVLRLALIIVLAVVAWSLWQRQGKDHTPGNPVASGSSETSVDRTMPKSSESLAAKPASLKAREPGKSASGIAESFIPQDGLASVAPDRFYTTSGMDGLVPRDRSSTFTVNDEVYVYAALNAPSRETISIAWYDSDGGKILPTAYIDVGINTTDRGYRIFTYRVFREPGDFGVKVFNSTGVKIGETDFTVVPSR